jgi:hypothetical protein
VNRKTSRSRAIVPITAAAVLVALFGSWVLRPGPADLRSVYWVAPSPRGNWLAFGGAARGHSPVFVENVETGVFLRASSFPVFSPDGSQVAWSTTSPGLPEPVFTPHTASLNDARHPSVAWETKGLHELPLLVFSADGRRLAIVASDRVVVWNAAGGGMVAAARPPSPLWEDSRGSTCATFAGDDRLMIYAVRDGAGRTRSIEIFAFDLPTRTFRRTGSAGPFAATFPIVADGSRRRLLVRENAATVHLLDAESGAILRTFGGENAVFRTAVFLSGGEIALFESEGGAGRVIVLSADGQERGRIPIGPADRAYLLGERRPGALALVAGSKTELRERRGRVIVADLAAGKAESWGEGLLPAAPYASFLAGDPGSGPAPESLGTRLFFTPDRKLVELVAPGHIRPVLPRR